MLVLWKYFTEIKTFCSAVKTNKCQLYLNTVSLNDSFARVPKIIRLSFARAIAYPVSSWNKFSDDKFVYEIQNLLSSTGSSGM